MLYKSDTLQFAQCCHIDINVNTTIPLNVRTISVHGMGENRKTKDRS